MTKTARNRSISKDSPSRKPAPPPITVDDAAKALLAMVGQDVHAARLLSLAGAAIGVIASCSLCIHAIGRGLAAARALTDKHAIKQVDRLLSNEMLNPWNIAYVWVPFVIGQRTAVTINLDWTEFDSDDQSMLVASLQTQHGRATPLLWKTVVKSTIKGKRNDYEDDLLGQLWRVMPEGVEVTLVADRGFSDTKLYELLSGVLGWKFAIRFRGVVHVTSDKGETKSAIAWLGNKRVRVLHHASLTSRHCPIGTVVIVHDKAMKEPWCIALSDPTVTSAQAKVIYGRRFSCEETFRDLKDLRYGMGLSWTRIRSPDRRDRLMLIATLAHALLTLLGAAGERAGLDRLLKSNTSKKRTLSLFRQGMRWYELIPTMPQERLLVLVTAYHEILQEHAIFKDSRWVI